MFAYGWSLTSLNSSSVARSSSSVPGGRGTVGVRLSFFVFLAARLSFFVDDMAFDAIREGSLVLRGARARRRPPALQPSIGLDNALSTTMDSDC